MMSAARKRFIAGAVCPSCNTIDTLTIWREDRVDMVACIQCGYHQCQSEQWVEKHLRPQEQVIGIFDLAAKVVEH